MRVVFTTSNRLGSRLIRWGSREFVSHVAVVVGKFVVHATPTGVDIDYLPNFLKKNEILLTLIHDVGTPAGEYADLDAITCFEGRKYDWLALLFMAVRALGTRFFGLPWPPKTNRWSNSGYLNCVEFASRVVLGEDSSNLTPFQFYQKLVLTGHWYDPRIPRDQIS